MLLIYLSSRRPEKKKHIVKDYFYGSINFFAWQVINALFPPAGEQRSWRINHTGMLAPIVCKLMTWKSQGVCDDFITTIF